MIDFIFMSECRGDIRDIARMIPAMRQYNPGGKNDDNSLMCGDFRRGLYYPDILDNYDPRPLRHTYI